MKEIDITPKMLGNASLQADKLKHLKEKIPTQCSPQFVGMLGEEIFHSLFPEAKRINNFKYDFELGNLTIDIKTKTSAIKPESYFDFTLAKEEYTGANVYVFIFVNKYFRTGWVWGWIDQKHLMKEGEHVKKGDPKPYSGGTYFKDAIRLPLKNNKIKPIKELKAYARRKRKKDDNGS